MRDWCRRGHFGLRAGGAALPYVSPGHRSRGRHAGRAWALRPTITPDNGCWLLGAGGLGRVHSSRCLSSPSTRACRCSPGARGSPLFVGPYPTANEAQRLFPYIAKRLTERAPVRFLLHVAQHCLPGLFIYFTDDSVGKALGARPAPLGKILLQATDMHP